MRKFETYQDVIAEFDWLPLALEINPEVAIVALVHAARLGAGIELLERRALAEEIGERSGNA